MTEPTNTARRLPWPLLLLPVFGLLVAGLIVLNTPRAGTLASTPIPTPLPIRLPNPDAPSRRLEEPAADFELRTLAETTTKLSDYRGRVVFLNFWATWCEPCQRELPAFVAFSQQQGSDGAVVLAVNVGETYDLANAYLNERGISGFPVLLDVRYTVTDLYGIGPIPVTFVIDGEGIIRFAHYGEISAEDMAEYVAELEA